MVAGATWIAAASDASSCGFEDPNSVHVARALIDWAYPRSLHVTSAVWQAQLDGVLAVSSSSQSPRTIVGAYGAAARALRRLGEELSRHQQSPRRPSISLVLIGPVLWARFAVDGTAQEPEIHSRGPSTGDVVVVTDQPVIEALVNGRLTTATAERRGLIRYYGADADVSAIRSILEKASPKQAGENSSSL